MKTRYGHFLPLFFVVTSFLHSLSAQSITGKHWRSIPGADLRIVSMNSVFESPEDGIVELEDLQMANIEPNCAIQIRGILVPEHTSHYTFWVSGDDQCEFWLAQTSDSHAAQLVASTPHWTAPLELKRFPEQQSKSIELIKDYRYYFEVRLKQGSGEGHFAVMWQDEESEPTVVASDCILPYQPLSQDSLSLSDEQGESDTEGTGSNGGDAFALRSAEGLAEWQIWTDISGNMCLDLLRNLQFPHKPDTVHYLQKLETISGYGNRYGGRLRGLIRIPKTGSYTFAISGDDQAEFWLGKTRSRFSKKLVAKVPSPTAPRDWNRYSDQISQPIKLQGGDVCYFEVLHKQDHGDDHISVGWKTPDKRSFSVIGSENLVASVRQEDDSDDNDLPDEWEIRMGLKSSNLKEASSTHGDPDGDGISNFNEYLRGTSPLESNVVKGRQNRHVLWELWEGIEGNRVRDLIWDSSFPGSPTSERRLSCLDTPLSTSDQYASRIRGYIVPKKDGRYRFFLAGDNNCQLWFSESRSPFEKELVSEINEWTTLRDYDDYQCQISGWIELKRQHRYYFEVLHKEGRMEDYVSVSWEREGDARRLITSEYLRSFAPIKTDQDDDGLPDKWERKHDIDASDPTGHNAWFGDLDSDGLTNLAEFQLNRNPRIPDAEFLPGLVRWDIYEGIEGRTLDDLFASDDFPGKPTGIRFLGKLETPEAFGDFYGTRIRGYVFPPRTGTYTFYISGDDECQLLLSSSKSKFDRNKIAFIPPGGYTGRHDWTRFKTQKSELIHLEKGKPYYIEVNHQEGQVLDHVSVGWASDNEDISVIDAKHLRSFENDPLDLDDDDLPDSWENRNGLDSTSAENRMSAYGDIDNDGLSNDEERSLNTNPILADTDGDSVDDGYEVHELFTDPLKKESQFASQVFAVSPKNYSSSSHNWIPSPDGVLYNVESDGTLEYEIQLSKGFNLIEIEVQSMRNPDNTPFLLSVSVSDIITKNFSFRIRGDQKKTLVLPTPFSQSCSCRMSIYYDNSVLGKRIGISGISVRNISGEDFNENEIPDWYERSLRVSNGLSTAGSKISSLVSPLCLEGNGDYQSTEVNGSSVMPGLKGQWYTNVPLDPIQPKEIIATFLNGRLTQNATLTWHPFEIDKIDDFIIRKNDSLLLTLSSSNRPFLVKIGNTIGRVADKTQPHQHCFTEIGEYVISATSLSGKLLANTTVTVVDHLPTTEIQIGVGKPYIWNSGIRDTRVTFDGDDAIEITNELKSANEYILELLGRKEGSYSILSRIPEGSILSRTEIRAIQMRYGTETGATVIKTFDDDSTLIEVPLILSYADESTRIEVDVVVAGVVFEDGTITKTLTYSDLENNRTKLTFFRAPGVDTSICHKVRLYSGEHLIGLFD